MRRTVESRLKTGAGLGPPSPPIAFGTLGIVGGEAKRGGSCGRPAVATRSVPLTFGACSAEVEGAANAFLRRLEETPRSRPYA